MGRTVAEKMGIRPSTRALLVDAPESPVAAINRPPLERATEAVVNPPVA